jgi:hypothetical protein
LGEARKEAERRSLTHGEYFKKTIVDGSTLRGIQWRQRVLQRRRQRHLAMEARGVIDPAGRGVVGEVEVKDRVGDEEEAMLMVNRDVLEEEPEAVEDLRTSPLLLLLRRRERRRISQSWCPRLRRRPRVEMTTMSRPRYALSARVLSSIIVLGRVIIGRVIFAR